MVAPNTLECRGTEGAPAPALVAFVDSCGLT
jgi:hypothetical protein